jgi:signal transduction histidine kinase
MRRGSLRLRLLLAGAISILAAVTLSAVGLTVLFQRHVERRVEAELAVYLDQIVAGLDRDVSGALVISRSPVDPRFSEPLSGLYWQVQLGETTLRSRSLWDGRLRLPEDELADGAVHRHRIAGPNGTQLSALERSVTLPERLGGGAMRVTVALDSADVAAATRAFAVDLLPYLALIAVLLIAAGYAQIAIGLRPLTTVRKRLSAIREHKTRRLGQGFPDEIVPLAEEVDALLEARERQIEKARARAGDLAHGLKTPLQVLSGDVERLRRKGEVEIAAEIEQVATAMRRHVDRELARARIGGGGQEACAGLAEVVERVVGVVVRTPAGARLNWSIDIPPDIIARIDPDDLAEAVGNLAENAARHARTEVSIRTRREIGFIRLTVVDDGNGIPPGQLEKALSRGGRLDRSGTGAGLGLAIVSEIAEAWDGRFEILNTAVGLEASLFLPIPEPPFVAKPRHGSDQPHT